MKEGKGARRFRSRVQREVEFLRSNNCDPSQIIETISRHQQFYQSNCRQALYPILTDEEWALAQEWARDRKKERENLRIDEQKRLEEIKAETQQKIRIQKEMEIDKARLTGSVDLSCHLARNEMTLLEAEELGVTEDEIADYLEHVDKLRDPSYALTRKASIERLGCTVVQFRQLTETRLDHAGKIGRRRAWLIRDIDYLVANQQNKPRIWTNDDLCYKTTAIKALGVTKTAFEKLGLKVIREVANPHYRSGPPSQLYAREHVVEAAKKNGITIYWPRR